MSHIITPRRTIHVPVYHLGFAWKDADGNATGAGFSFSCDAKGNVITDKMAEPAREHLAACLSGAYDVIAQGVVDYSYDYREPARLRCECRAIVSLEFAMTNECDSCGRLYNMSGQLLAPRCQWDERGEY